MSETMKERVSIHLALLRLRSALGCHSPGGAECSMPVRPCELCDVVPMIDALLRRYEPTPLTAEQMAALPRIEP